MNCAYHAEAQNVAFCIRCGKPLCAVCIHNVRGSVYCETCLAELVEGKTPTSGTGPQGAASGRVDEIGGGNPTAAFVLGLIPGVGAIYNAEYFKAAVHILIFGSLIAIHDSGPRAAEPLLGMMTFGFFLYMPFEAYYTAKKNKMRREGVDLQTPFDRFNEQLGGVKNKELWGGMVLVILGSLFLLDNFDILRLDNIFRLWPIALIVAGVFLLKRFQDKDKVT